MVFPMPTWDAKQYLTFNDQRTRPCRELAERVELDRPGSIIDLGCGPGNSTAVLAQRWPDSSISGLDSSPEMIAAARKSDPARPFRVADISDWANGDGEIHDLVFSNAAIQWVNDHAAVLPRLMKHVAPGGAFAMQVPCNDDAPAHVIMREMAESPGWHSRFASGWHEWHIHEPFFYYDVLAPHAATLDVWVTEYIHIMENSEAIVQWYKGTALRAFLDVLPTAEEKQAFEAEYTQHIRQAYPVRADGRMVFPFRRLFVIAYRMNL
jgi:trans-aconitate 2-methyltransferase